MADLCFFFIDIPELYPATLEEYDKFIIPYYDCAVKAQKRVSVHHGAQTYRFVIRRRHPFFWCQLGMAVG